MIYKTQQKSVYEQKINWGNIENQQDKAKQIQLLEKIDSLVDKIEDTGCLDAINNQLSQIPEDEINRQFKEMEIVLFEATVYESIEQLKVL